MKLHIFNPEHDIALAHNLRSFTAPHAGRQLRADLGFFPALWAEKGDLVMVDNREAALEQARHWRSRIGTDVEFVEPQEVAHHCGTITEIVPWGWDSALVAQLERMGVAKALLPDDTQLGSIRSLSNRATAVNMLRQMGGPEHSWLVKNIEELEALILSLHTAVIKEPWSCSGRGVRYVENGAMTIQQRNWAQRVLRTQGCLEVEPYYNKVVDFGMEFLADDNKITYRGLSVFSTVNGFYTGNLVATEEEKQNKLAPYVDINTLSDIQESIKLLLSKQFLHIYRGPIGVDMMVYADNMRNLHIHPLVEVNVRKTMGHVAIDLLPGLKGGTETMRVEYRNNRYKLNLTKNKVQ